MRLLVALILVLAASGCAGGRKARPSCEETLAKLSFEVSLLPAADSKTRIEQLVAALEAQMAERRRASAGEKETANLRAFASAARPTGIELGFATRGKDWSGDGADDGVEVYITPRDSAGSAMKCPGSAEVRLVETAGGFFKSPQVVDKWVISPDTLRISWNEALFPAYVLPLPWHGKPPAAGAYDLVVEFAPLGAQALSATRRIDVEHP